VKTAEDLAGEASLSAVGQYRHAASVHRLVAGQLKADGWDEFAREVEAFVERLERAAVAEGKPWRAS